jgi:hypothetical protein
MNKTFKRASIVAGSVGAVAAIATASFAFFTATTSVTTHGTTETVQAATVQGAVLSAPLYPGDCEDVTFTLHNPNQHNLNGIYRVNTVSVDGSGGVAEHLHLAPYLHAGATTADLVAGGYNFQQVLAGSDTNVVLPNGVCMDLSAPDQVQGQDVTVDLNLSLKQQNGTEYTGVN